MIFDSHCHLNSKELFPKVEEVIKKAQSVGVNRFLVIGYDKETSLLAVKLANQYDCCYATVGFHPTEIEGVSEESYQEIIELAKNEPKVVGIGEIGLDYFWVKDTFKKEEQKKWFIKQIKLANELKKPIVIHNRDSHEDCFKIIKEYKPLYGCVMHCFSGSVELLNELLKIDNAYISLGGPVTFKNAVTPKEVAKVVPLDRLLIETDCPYLTPHPFRGKENSPYYITYVRDEIALLKNIDKEVIEAATTSNTCKLFGITK